jgi:hypothetical protein
MTTVACCSAADVSAVKIRHRFESVVEHLHHLKNCLRDEHGRRRRRRRGRQRMPFEEGFEMGDKQKQQ